MKKVEIKISIVLIMMVISMVVFGVFKFKYIINQKDKVETNISNQDIITETNIINNNFDQPYKFEDFKVEENFDKIESIKFEDDFTLVDNPNYWNDWKEIFKNYDKTSENDFAGHYKFFEMPNGTMNNFSVVDINTGKIYDNNLQLSGDTRYFYKPNSELLIANVDNYFGEYYNYNKSLLENLEDYSRIYIFYDFQNNKPKFLNAYILSNKKYVKIDLEDLSTVPPENSNIPS